MGRRGELESVDDLRREPDEVLCRSDATYGALMYKRDNQGNVLFLLDGSNRRIEQYTYDVFGRATVTSWNYQTASWKPPSDRSSFGNRFMYTGREWIADIQHYDYRHRLYNPDTGRFLQTDPIGFDAGDMNLFRYCGDDPVDRTDPFGLVSGFREYILVYDKEEKIDDTHDGYHIEGKPGTEETGSEAVRLEVDRSVSTMKSINGTHKGGDTNVTETVSTNGGAPSVHQQIDVRYASGAGPKTRQFTRYNEWTHSKDAVASANRLRAELNGWVRTLNMSPDAARQLIRDGVRHLEGTRVNIPSLQQHRDGFMSDQRTKWDDRYAPNGWRTPNGTLVAPHNPIDSETGNPLDWNQ
jgi:RHS repeat-associated protein